MGADLITKGVHNSIPERDKVYLRKNSRENLGGSRGEGYDAAESGDNRDKVLTEKEPDHRGFDSRLWFLTGQEFALCYALGHTDTSMTKQYTSLDKVELARAFPDIADKKNSVVEDKTSLRVPKQGDIELYSNFGFMVKKS